MAGYPYPLTGFHFSVSFEGLGNSAHDGFFQRVDGLVSTAEFKEYIEGGENRFKHYLPQRINYSDITLSRGTMRDSAVTDWCLDAMENFVWRPLNLMISLLDQEHQPLLSWYVVNAIPLSCKWGALDAEKSEVLIETLELKIQYFNTIKSQ